MFFAIAFFILVFGLVITGFILIKHLQNKGMIMRSLNMSLFLVILPRYEKDKEGERKDEKERIALMEQLLSSFINLKTGSLKGIRQGVPYIVFEMAVHNEGESVHTYIAVPKSIESILEKQIHGFFPEAQVEKVKDYNIFNPRGASAGSYLTLERHSVLPLQTYQTLSADPMGNIITAMTKIEKQNEGVALQLVLTSQDTKNQKKLVSSIIQEEQK